jgi:quercetin dioxygenase-like cupin family protein
MPVMSGFGALAELPWERVTDKIERRVLAGQQGMIVWWKMKAGAHAAAHQHPHEQIVWMLKGKMASVSGTIEGPWSQATLR